MSYSNFNTFKLFQNVGINSSSNYVLSMKPNDNNVSFHSSNSIDYNNVDIMSIKNIINKAQNEDLNLSSLTGTTINPVITINNNNQDCRIMTNLNVNGNLNLTNGEMIQTTGIGSFGLITTTGDTTIGANLNVLGNLNITGNMNQINSTQITVNDKNIILASNNNANNHIEDGGLILQGTTPKSILWKSTDGWSSSEKITAPDLKINGIGTFNSIDSGSITTTGIGSFGSIYSGTPIAATNGGTGIGSFTTGDIFYASDTNTLTKLSPGYNGQILTLTNGIPQWKWSIATNLYGVALDFDDLPFIIDDYYAGPHSGWTSFSLSSNPPSTLSANHHGAITNKITSYNHTVTGSNTSNGSGSAVGKILTNSVKNKFIMVHLLVKKTNSTFNTDTQCMFSLGCPLLQSVDTSYMCNSLVLRLPGDKATTFIFGQCGNVFETGGPTTADFVQSEWTDYKLIFKVDSNSKIGHVHEFLNNIWQNTNNKGISNRNKIPIDLVGASPDIFDGVTTPGDTNKGLQFGIGVGGDSDYLRDGVSIQLKNIAYITETSLNG
jgi:hypothetical protein